MGCWFDVEAGIEGAIPNRGDCVAISDKGGSVVLEDALKWLLDLS